MPPRLPPTLSALRQGISSIKASTPTATTIAASISTTAAPRAFRNSLGNTTTSMLNLGGNGNPPTSPPRFTPRESSPLQTPSSAESLGDMYKRFRLRPGGSSSDGGNASGSENVEDKLRGNSRQADHMRQLTRRWRVGDVYAPHDLSPSEMAKWQRASARKKDVVDLLGLRPLDMYRNFSMISEFMTPHGRIKRGVETGLSPVNQRKMAKAIRRAIGLGLHPSVHRHPEILMRGPDRVLAQNIAAANRAHRFK